MSTGVTLVFSPKSIIGGRGCMKGNRHHEQAARERSCPMVPCVPKNSEALGIGSGRTRHVFRPTKVLLRRLAGDPPERHPDGKFFVGTKSRRELNGDPRTRHARSNLPEQGRFRSRNETTRVGLDSIVAPFGRREDQNVGTEVRRCRG
jgi:hypothetical protein